MKPQEKYFVHKGIKLYYFSDGIGKPLLFLPGGLRVSTYLTNIRYLSRWYRVIALDLPGFGKSSVPKTIWGRDDYADFITLYLKSQKLSNIYVVGHSYGGGVGLYLAMKQGFVSKLVLFDPMGVASNHSRIGFYFNMMFTKTSDAPRSKLRGISLPSS